MEEVVMAQMILLKKIKLIKKIFENMNCLQYNNDLSIVKNVQRWTGV